MKTIMPTLDTQSSVELLSAIEDQPESFALLCTGPLEYEVHIDGAQTLFKLHLRENGTWSISVELEV